MKPIEARITRFTSKAFRKRWDIDDFHELCRPNEGSVFDIYSSWFPQEPSEEHWRVHIHSEKYIFSHITFTLESDMKDFVIGVITIVSEYMFDLTCREFKIPKEVLLNGNILRNGTLSLLCEVFSDIKTENESQSFDIPSCTLSRDFESLFLNDTLSDVAMLVNGQELKTNKVILAACSKVFRAMLQNDMLEAKTGRIEIEQVEFSVMEELLRFAHTGRISPNVHRKEELLTSLLHTADKYDMMVLKLMCEDYLSQCLTKNNVADLLSLTELLPAKLLKKRIFEFMGSGSVKALVIPESTLVRKVRLHWTIYFPHFVCITPMNPAVIDLHCSNQSVQVCWYGGMRFAVRGQLQVKCCVVKKERREVLCNSSTNFFDSRGGFFDNGSLGCRVLQEEALKYKCVTLLIQYFDTQKQNPTSSTPYCRQLGRQLLSSPDWKDLTLLIGGQEVQVHKAIMAVRCPALLENNNILEHVDMDIAQLIIKHIYTGRVKPCRFVGKEFVVMSVARDLALWRLHAFCLNVLCTKVTSGTAAELFCSALKHQCHDLVEYIRNYIRRDFMRVQGSAGWQMYKDALQTFLLP